MEERLADAISRVPGWSGASATSLSGGITNVSHRVDVGSESFVLRLADTTSAALGIDRERELAALRAMAALGVGAEVVFADVGAGILVTRLLPGRPLEKSDLHVASVLERLAKLIRRVHDSPSFGGRFSPFAVVRDYERQARARGVEVDAAAAFATMAVIERCLAETEPRPCHNDLLAANVVIDGDDLHIIDWEYAAMGNPLFDLANFATNLELDERETERFFSAYLGRESSQRERAGLSALRFMSDLREAFWGILQAAISSVELDFRAYGERHLARAEAYTTTSTYRESLALLTEEQRS